MKLIEALLQEARVPKAIIMGGGAGAGKTHLAGQFIKIAEENGWQYLNPDTYARNPDKEKRLPLSSASKKINQELEDAVTGDAKPNLVWDTTASNPNAVLGVKQNGYNVLMIMVYAHPMAAFQSNFERADKEGEAAIPTQGVFATWLKSYNPENIEAYKKAFGDNFLLVNNTSKPGIDMKLIEDFNQAVEAGPKAIQKYIEDLVEEHPDKYKQTMFDRGEVELPTEAAEAFTTGVAQAGIIFQDEREENNLKKAALKYFEKKGEPMPPAKIGRTNGMEETLETLRKKAKASEETKQRMYVELHAALSKVISADSTIDEAVDRAKAFIES